MKAGGVVQAGMGAVVVVAGLAMMPGTTEGGTLPQGIGGRACTRSAHTSLEVRWDTGRNFACMYLPDSRQFAWRAIGPYNPTAPPAPFIPAWEDVAASALSPSV
jgi:hypothetical protein